MRIGFVHFARYPDIRVSKMMASLADAGHELVVVARTIVPAASGLAAHPYATEAERQMQARSNVVLRSMSPPMRRVATVPYHVNPVWRRAVRDLVVRDRCDLLLVREIPLALAAVAAGREQGVPIVLDMAENYPALLAAWRRWEGRGRALVNSVARNVALARRLERAVVRAVDAVLVVVPEHVDRVTALRGSTDNVIVVENTPALDELDQATAAVPMSGSNRLLELVCSGGVHYYRGIDTLVDAAALLRDRGGPDARWTVVGDGKLAELRARAARRGVGDVVRFVGFQPEVLRFVARADVGIVPPHRSAHYDVTMPNKLYDYMALRKPVVVSDTIPMRRVVQSTECGLVFESGNAAGLAEQVAKLVDPEVRRSLGENGRRAVETRYRWDVDARTLVETIERLSKTKIRPDP